MKRKILAVVLIALLSTNLWAATAVNDTYDGNALSTIIDINFGVGYVLQPNFLVNDVVTNILNIDQGTLDNGYTTVQGFGFIQRFGQLTNPAVTFRYFPAGGPFNQPAIFTYSILDNGDGSTSTGQITITPPPAPTAADDVYNADQLTTVIDTEIGLGYQLTTQPLANDSFTAVANLDGAAIQPSLVSGSGSISVNLGSATPSFTYFPGNQAGTFTQPAVFNYTVLDLATLLSVTAQITINPPSSNTPPPPPVQNGASVNSINDACAQTIPQPAYCDDQQVSPTERKLSLATVGAQADALFDMQGDQIANLRQRLNELRDINSPLSVAGINARIYGKDVPLGKIAQSLLNPIQGGSAGEEDANGSANFFLMGNFSVGDRDASLASGAYDSDGYGFTGGVDYRISTNMFLGGALGFASQDTSFASNRGEQQGDITSLSFYGNFYPARAVYVDWLLMATHGNLDIERTNSLSNQVARATTDSTLTSAAATFGYEWAPGAWTINGYLRGEYTDMQIDAYAESGGDYDLRVAEQNSDSLEAALGFKIAYVVSLENGIVIPSFDAEWLHQYKDDIRLIGASMEQIAVPFYVTTEAPDTEYVNGAFSLTGVFASGFSAYLRAESLFGDERQNRGRYSAGMRWEF